MSALVGAWARARALSDSAVLWLTFAAVSVPLVVAAVALAGRTWYPVLDLAMTELRVRDVGTVRTPLIGLPGRIGRFPEQGSHPGPLSFYLLTPVYRLFGSSSYGLLVSTVVLAMIALGAALWLARRLGGKPLVLLVGLVLIILVRGYGTEVIVQPWNPYLPLLFWLVVLLATWAVVAGDDRMVVVVVAAGSLCAQTHIPYLGLVVGLGVVCIVAATITWIRHPLARNDILRGWQLSVVVAAVLWVPVLIDQLTRSPGNVSMLREHFSNPTEPVVGLGEGTRLLLRHLDVVRLIGEALDGDAYFVRAGFDLTGSTATGTVVLALWLVAFAVAIRLRAARLVALHVVLGSSLLLGLVSMSRIFGKVWYYLTLWAWGTTVLIVVATAWTLAVALTCRTGGRPIRPSRSTAVRAALASLGAVAGLVSLVAATVEAAGTQPPEDHLSGPLGALVGPTEDAVRLGAGAADGAGGRYVVTWTDALYFGSQGYGLVNELERRGLDVGVPDPWRVPVTEHRVLEPREATAEIHFATGSYIAEWRARPDAAEVAYVEPRDADELAEYQQLEASLVAELDAGGMSDLVALVTTNLFGIQLDPRVPMEVQQVVDRMLHLGQPAAVFIVPVTFGP
jgi:hypothetical protein